MDRIPYMTQVNFMCTNPPTDQHLSIIQDFVNTTVARFFSSINDVSDDIDSMVESLIDYTKLCSDAINDNDNIPLSIWIDNVYTIKFIDGKFYYEQGLEEAKPVKMGLEKLKNIFIDDNINNADVLLVMINVTVKGVPASVIDFPYHREEV